MDLIEPMRHSLAQRLAEAPEADSPHYYDQTELYARGEWLQLPFTDEEILADPNLRTLTLRGD